MYNKLYEEIKKIIKNNYTFILSFIIAFLIVNVKLPYYINIPGGTSDITSRIVIENYDLPKDSYKMAYVSELRATIPTYIYSLFNKDWDIIKKEEIILNNETKDDVKFRDTLMLNEANNQAIILAYEMAGKKIEIKRESFFITYVDESAITDLKVGDEILSINGEKINDYKKLNYISQKFKKDQIVKIKVKNNNQIIDKQATVIEFENRLILGVLISVEQDIKTTPPIKFNFKKREGGPSGGFMMTLAIYDSLTGNNLNKGRVIVGTGTIDQNGNIGEVGGVKYKLKGVVKEGADIFFVPAKSNYHEIIKIKEDNNYDINIVPVSTLEEAINYLKTTQ